MRTSIEMRNGRARALAFSALEPRWRQRGYTILREPGKEELPAFLSEVRPDAIATGRTPNIVIELVDSDQDNSQPSIARLRELLENHPDWELEVVYLGASSDGPTSETREAIVRTLADVERLQSLDPRAALLLAWAALEAAARLRSPDQAQEALSVPLLIDLLVSEGLVEQEDFALLKWTGQQRPPLAHGELGIAPEAFDVSLLASLARSVAVG